MPGFTIKVPASSGNMGAGFDTIGVAHDLYNELKLNISSSVSNDPKLFIAFTSDNLEANRDIPADQSNLVYRVFAECIHKLDRKMPAEITMEFDNQIPVARGLGSSTTAILMGVFSAVCAVNAQPDPGLAIKEVFQREGHLDNGAPSFFGGATLSWAYNDLPYVRLLGVNPNLSTTVLIPDFPVLTEQARQALPEQVPFRDALINLRSSALLVNLLSSPNFSNWDLLQATQDALHQPYRQSLMPASWELMTTLREQGYPAMISGAGPTILVLQSKKELEPSSSIIEIAEDFPNFQVRPTNIPATGIQVQQLRTGN
ncbi:MAG: homoserine kinase [Bifidobacteriaceae bacterium]|jgi:homoserine kinase|nr:homoserine kinase [Bifidobacteriaceae bacterium]